MHVPRTTSSQIESLSLNNERFDNKKILKISMIGLGIISIIAGLAANYLLLPVICYYSYAVGATGLFIGALLLTLALRLGKKNISKTHNNESSPQTGPSINNISHVHTLNLDTPTDVNFDKSYIEASVNSIKINFQKMTALLGGKKRASQFDPEDPTTKQFIVQSDLKILADEFASHIPEMKLTLKTNNPATVDLSSEPSGLSYIYKEGEDPHTIHSIVSEDKKIEICIASGYEIQKDSSDKQIRGGDPIADNMLCSRFSTDEGEIIIFSGADGSGHGESPYLSAVNANKGYTKYLTTALQKGIYNRKELIKTMVLAVDAANNSIVKQARLNCKKNIGMTTHLGAVVYKMNGKYYGVATSVGDMKLVIQRKDGTFEEITKGNRGNIDDPTDPGGQLGPKLGPMVDPVYDPIGTCPDLRNFSLFLFEAEEGDVLLPMSDGVHDNFDPKMTEIKNDQVFSPEEARQVLIENGVRGVEDLKLPARWPSKKDLTLNDEERSGVQIIQELFFIHRLSFVRDQYKSKNTSLAGSLVEYSINNAEKQRSDIENNKSEFRKIGKMDHISCAEIQL